MYLNFFVVWIGFVVYGLLMIFGFVVSVLVNCFGYCVVMIIGGILCFIVVFGFFFVIELGQMFGFFFVIYGIGVCMFISFIMIIVLNYFDKYMIFVVGFMIVGSSVGILIMVFLFQVFIDVIGWRNMFCCFVGICFFSVVCCCLV